MSIYLIGYINVLVLLLIGLFLCLFDTPIVLLSIGLIYIYYIIYSL